MPRPLKLDAVAAGVSADAQAAPPDTSAAATPTPPDAGAATDAATQTASVAVSGAQDTATAAADTAKGGAESAAGDAKVAVFPATFKLTNNSGIAIISPENSVPLAHAGGGEVEVTVRDEAHLAAIKRDVEIVLYRTAQAPDAVVLTPVPVAAT